MQYHILVASLTLMAMFQNIAIRVRQVTSIYGTLMKICFKDWSQPTSKGIADYAVEKQYQKNILPQESLSVQESWYLKKINQRI